MAKRRVPIFYFAAGGVVSDAAGENVLLLIRPSRDEVRLPKGHIEAGEAPEDAALRAVSEESGYGALEILDDLGEQFVAFPVGKHAGRRTEHYYLMRLRTPREVERPQEDERQFFPIWVSWEEALTHLTFEAEQEWIRRAQAHLKAASHEP